MNWKTELLKWIRTLIELALIGAVIYAAIWALGSISFAESEMECWVICQPESYVNVRKGPGNHREIVGYAVAGMRFRTDGKEKNGFLHIVDASNEYGFGWIHSGYVVFSEPEGVDREVTVKASGRVACRERIDGKRRGWVRNGDTVHVYWRTRSWAVTEKGFIQTKYLGE